MGPSGGSAASTGQVIEEWEVEGADRRSQER